MKTVRLYLLPALMGALVGISILATTGFLIKTEKIAFVDNERLFNEFYMKLELEKDLHKAEITKQAGIDSGKVALELFGKRLQSKANPSKEELIQYEESREQLAYLEQEVFQENEQLASKMNAQIWSQINQLVREYAEDEGIDILLGTTAQGNLMYAGEYYNATDGALKYINSRYKGK